MTSFGFPPPTKEMAKVPLLFGLLGILMLWLNVSDLGSSLLLGGSALAIVAILVQRVRHELSARRYSTTAGAVITENGVTFNGDAGPRHYRWNDFGAAFVSELHGKPIIQHLAVEDLHRTGYDQYSSYFLQPVDYLALAPDEFLALLQAQPNYPRNAS